MLKSRREEVPVNGIIISGHHVRRTMITSLDTDGKVVGRWGTRGLVTDVEQNLPDSGHQVFGPTCNLSRPLKFFKRVHVGEDIDN